MILIGEGDEAEAAGHEIGQVALVGLLSRLLCGQILIAAGTVWPLLNHPRDRNPSGLMDDTGVPAAALMRKDLRILVSGELNRGNAVDFTALVDFQIGIFRDVFTITA